MKSMLLVIVIGVLLTLSGCADNVGYFLSEPKTPVGFLHGLWHGIILPFSFFISLFSDNVSVYAIYNSGGWYDFGFLLGIGMNYGSFISSNRK